MRGKLLTMALSRALLLVAMLLPGIVSAQDTVCVRCHGNLPDRLGEPVRLWRGSVHAANGITCHSCHGGDPTDMAMAMSPERGFIGKPTAKTIPEFCGRCHIGVREDYQESAHGRALGRGGPQCVTCHSNHQVVKATPDLINPLSCGRCHSYGRAGEIREAVVATDAMIVGLEERLAALHHQGIDTGELKGELFSLRNGFHRLFHSVDVEKVRSRTAAFQRDLAAINGRISVIDRELADRRIWGGIAVALFVMGGIVALLIYRSYRDGG